MKPKFLLDENMEPGYHVALRQLYPQIDVLAVGDPGAPPRQTSDQQILLYADQSQRILVTKNRRSILERHLPEHLNAGGKTWGIFWVRQDTSFTHLAEELSLIWEDSEAEEWANLLLTIPYFT